MRLLPAALVVAATGCAQVLGLDETTGTAEPMDVSLSMQRWSIGAAVQKNPLDLTGQMASFLVDDGAGGFSTVPGEQVDTNTFSAPIADGTPAVLFTLPDMPTPFRRLWAQPARERHGVFAVFEHPGALEPLPNSSLTLTATLPSAYVATEAFRIEAIGAWMASGVTPAQLADGTATTITATVPYASFGRMTGSPAARITSQDVVVVERYTGNQLTGVYQVPAFDQTDGADPITATVVAVPADKALNAAIDPTTLAQRFSAVRPAVSGLSMPWRISAAPGWTLGSTTGARLNAGSAATTDTAIAAMFGNPFESLDWRSMLQFTAQATRSYAFQGIAMTLTSSMLTVQEPSDTLTLDMPAGMPINIRVNEVPLSTDGMTVPLDLTKGVVIDAITDKPDNTVYFATVYEVALGADMTTVERTVAVDALTTVEPKLTLPPELFQVDHFYYVDFRCMQGGYLGGAAGDLETVTLPFSVSRADSAVFQVVAP